MNHAFHGEYQPYLDIIRFAVAIVGAFDFSMLLPIGTRRRERFPREGLLFLSLALSLALVIAGNLVRLGDPLSYRIFLSSIYVVMLGVWLSMYVQIPLLWSNRESPYTTRVNSTEEPK